MSKLNRKTITSISLDSEMKWKAITDNMHDMICQIDSNGIFQYISPSYHAILGYSPKDLVEKSAFGFIHDEDRNQAHEIFQECLKNRMPGKAIYRFRHADGHYLWLESVGNPLLSSQGELMGAVVATRDISERTQKEQAFLHSENKLKEKLKIFTVLNTLALNMSTGKTLKKNLRHIVEKCRDAFGADVSYIALSGAKDKKFISMHTYSGIRTDALKDFVVAYGNDLGGLVMKTKKGYAIKDIFADKTIVPANDGSSIKEGLVSISAVPILFKHDCLGVLYVANRKKTTFSQDALNTMELFGNLAAVEIKRKESEKTIQSQYDFLQKLIDTIPDIVYFKDISGRILIANKAFEKLIGLPQKAIIGKADLRLFPTEAVKQFKETDEKVLTTRKAVHYEQHYMTKDNKEMYVDTIKTPIFDQNGTITGLLGVSRDIKEKVHYQNRMFELFKYLGVVNRRVSVLLGMSFGGKRRRYDDIIEFIMNSAIHISGEALICLYYYNQEDNRFYLLASSQGIPPKNEKKLSSLVCEEYAFLKRLKKRKSRVQGYGHEFDFDKLCLGKPINHALAVPLVTSSRLLGCLVFSFTRDECLTTQELEFYEVFSVHAAQILENVEIKIFPVPQ